MIQWQPLSGVVKTTKKKKRAYLLEVYCENVANYPLRWCDSFMSLICQLPPLSSTMKNWWRDDLVLDVSLGDWWIDGYLKPLLWTSWRWRWLDTYTAPLSFQIPNKSTTLDSVEVVMIEAKFKNQHSTQARKALPAKPSMRLRVSLLVAPALGALCIL